MQKDVKDFFLSLLQTASPSGYEQVAAGLWREYCRSFANSISSDFHGNSFATVTGKQDLRIMLAGHIDEIGFIVSYIDEQGFVHFRPIGGHDRSLIAGRGVNVLSATGPLYGVLGRKAIHLLTPEERKKIPEYENIWIDIGVANREEAEAIVQLGDAVVYDGQPQFMGNDLIVSRGLDDKAGALVVARALQLIASDQVVASVTAVATVQKEIGLRGARTSAFAMDPHIGIAVDVTHATDHPEINPRREGKIDLGAGPVILRGANANPVLVDLFIETARARQIPYQIDAIGGGTGTDANAIQLSRSGVATALLSIPLRYMHTPREIVSLSDIENAAKLIAAVASAVDDSEIFRLG
jgi:putative aminopeptidase FrvX